MHEKNQQRRFTSRWGFVLAAVGSAVGMANVWGFPAKMWANGGGAFLLAYLCFILLFGTVGLAAEYAVGRRARTGTLGAYRMAWASRSRKLRPAGAALGWLPLAGSMCIAIGYAVIISYVLRALFASVDGSLMTTPPEPWFQAFSGADYSVVPFHVIVVIGTLLTLLLGAKSIEKTNKVMMPLFFVIFVALAVRVAFLPGAAKGYAHMFTIHWADLRDPEVWIQAMGQAFFSLSVTGSGMIVYGAYLDPEEDVASLARRTALFDTIAALVAALVIIPAGFAYGVPQDKAAGPTLLFVVLPQILQGIPFGRVFAMILYTAMVFAGVSSLQNMFEAVGESLLHRFPKLGRKTVLVILCVICLGIGLHMEPIFKWGPWMDIVSIYIIPIGAILGAVSWFWIMRREDLLEEINRGAKRPLGRLWHGLGRYVYVSCAVILCVVALILQESF